MNTSLRNLEFSQGVQSQLRILNKVLREHSKTELFDNPDIQFELDWCSQNFLVFTLSRPNSNSVELRFHLLPDGMRIDFDGYQEAWEVPAATIERDNTTEEVLERLIASPILVEYKGGAKFVNLFNTDGSRFAVWALQSFPALLFRGYWKSQSIDQHLFDPIYPRSGGAT
ncbi:MAG TPA: hypothetical protein VJV05_09180 [Pyrinomonadaceae bacterium]|nr:hypothetical protein [Pyrinomonadaceae bacterium]